MRRILITVALLTYAFVALTAQTSSAVFVSEDRVTQGAWRDKGYGGVCVSLYPDGAQGDCPDMWARGWGTQYRANGVLFDADLPQRRSSTNCCDRVIYNGGVVETGAPWPPNARFWPGGYHRIDVPGQKLRVGLTLPVRRLVRFYFTDHDHWQRVERIDIFTDSGIPVNEPGSLGAGVTANGTLLVSHTIDHFEGGMYVTFAAVGKVIAQFTAGGVTPEGVVMPIADDLGSVAVVSGLFVDAVSNTGLSSPRGLRIIGE